MMLRFVVVTALLVAGSAGAAGDAAKCKLQVVQALPEREKPGAGQEIDPRLDRLKTHFERAPFTAWKRFKLIEERTFDVEPQAPPSLVPLPGGRTAALGFVDHVKRDDGKHRLRLKLDIDAEKKRLLSTVIVLDEGGVFLEAGLKLDPGLLVLAFSCVTGA
jgi:hypothetical protein